MIALLAVAALAADPTLCDRLAADIRTLATDGAAFRRTIASEQGPFATRIHLPKTSAIPAAEDARLRAMFPDDADGGITAVYRLGPLSQALWVQGTLHCQADGFVRRGADGAVTKLPTPPAYDDLCWTSSRQIGTVDEKPDLIEQDVQTQPYEGVDIEVTPWLPGWGTPCGLRVRYDDRFALAQRLCGGDAAICAAGAALAVPLSEAAARGRSDAQLQAMVAPSAAVMAAQRADFAAASARIDDMGDDSTLPAFGATPATDYPDYSYPTSHVMVVVAGQPLLARIGIGGIGWRAIGDRLVTLYRFPGGRPTPVASYIVKQTVTGLRSAVTFTPQPHPDDR